ncbi:MAG: hypothetical protein JSW08_00200 [archaeon]|nr:MAG: hypothetical protein JSW08_00200 [archaeon]
MGKRGKILFIIMLIVLLLVLILPNTSAGYTCEEVCDNIDGINPNGWCQNAEGCFMNTFWAKCKCDRVLWWCNGNLEQRIDDCREKNCCRPISMRECFENKVVDKYTGYCNPSDGRCDYTHREIIKDCSGNRNARCSWISGPPEDWDCLCNNNFDDCDMNWNNGCEANLLTDFNNCGGCGNACDPEIHTSCQEGSCMGYCDITSASLTNFCPEGKCGLEDTLVIDAELEGTCQNVKEIVIRLTGLGCSINIEGEGNLQGENYHAEYSLVYLPGECIGKLAGSVQADIYNKTHLLNSTNNVNGDVEFDSAFPTLSSIYFFPKLVAISGDYEEESSKMFVFVEANYSDGSKIDVSTNKLINYSIKSSVHGSPIALIYPFLEDPSEEKNKFVGNFPAATGASGNDIVINFPYSLKNTWTSITNTSKVIITNVGDFSKVCYIIKNSQQTHISNAFCGEHGCGRGDKIEVKAKLYNYRNQQIQRPCWEEWSRGLEFDNITIFATSNGECPLFILSESLDHEEDCVDFGFNSICTKNLTIGEIPVGCSGKEMVVYGVSFHQRPNSRLHGVFGEPMTFFKNFTLAGEPITIPPGANKLFITPKEAEIKVGEEIEYYVVAVNDLVKRSVSYTLNNPPFYGWTHFKSNNEGVANNTREPRYKFRGEREGFTTIEITYPWPQQTGWPNPISNTTRLIVRPPTTCDIYEAKITPYCTQGDLCQQGDNISLNVTLKPECLDTTNNLNRISFNLSDSFGSQIPIDSCAFLLTGIVLHNEDCNYPAPSGKKVCIKNVSLQRLGEQCSGKKVYAYRAEVRNSSSFLDSLTGYPPNDFGEITLSGPLIGLNAIITHPNDGDYFTMPYTDTLWLNQTSTSTHGEIISWQWFIKRVSQQVWHLISSSLTNTNVSWQPLQYIGTNPGAYNLKHNISNGTTTAEDTVKIYFCDPDKPCAIIDSPKGIVNSRNVTFDGQRSLKINDPLNDFNLTWFFGDEENVSGNYGDLKTTYHIFDKRLARKEPFYANLTAFDTQSSTIDFTNFKIAVCEDSSGLVFVGECSNQEPNWCNPASCGNDGECEFSNNCTYCGCPNSQICNHGNQQCEPARTPQDCSGRGTIGYCLEESSCYWDQTTRCNACYDQGQRTITECSQYNYPTSCNADSTHCQVGINGNAARSMMGRRREVNGQTYEVVSTKCGWIDNEGCKLLTTENPVTGGGNQDPLECQYNSFSSGCGPENGGCMVGTRKGRYVNVTALARSPDYCTNYSTCQACGLSFERLPFFDKIHFIISIIFIALIYLFLIKRKK